MDDDFIFEEDDGDDEDKPWVGYVIVYEDGTLDTIMSADHLERQGDEPATVGCLFLNAVQLRAVKDPKFVQDMIDWLQKNISDEREGSAPVHSKMH